MKTEVVVERHCQKGHESLGDQGGNWPLTKKDGNVSARPASGAATPNRETAAKGEKLCQPEPKLQLLGQGSNDNLV